MEKNMSRAARRSETRRLKAKRRFYYGRDLAQDPVRLGIVVHTAANCSCHYCRNPRRHSGERTIQELRVLQRHAA